MVQFDFGNHPHTKERDHKCNKKGALLFVNAQIEKKHVFFAGR
jgi:hypothetical protein